MWLNTIKYIAIAVAIAIVGFFVNNWKTSIEENATLAKDNAQLTQALKESQIAQRQLEILLNAQAEFVAEAERKNKEVDDKLKSLEEYLNSTVAVKDSIKECIKKNSADAIPGESSEVLKRTIRELSRPSK